MNAECNTTPCEAVDILTVTMNPTLDVTTRVERLVHRDKLRCETEQEQVGGGGLNVAQVIGSLGRPCTAAFTAGGWRGREIGRRLAAEGIDCRAMPIEEESRQCFTVYETSTGQEYRFILPGPTLSEDEWQTCLQTLTTCSMNARWLIASGSLAPGIPEDFYLQLLSETRRQGLQIVLDTASQPLELALTTPIDWIKPSRAELQQLVGYELDSLDVCQRACEAILARHPLGGIALSLGSEGALLCRGEERLFVEPLRVEVTSTVGAGDSFVGGLIWALDENKPLDEAARIATACAASALQTQGSLHFDRERILQAAQDVRVHARDATF